MDFVWRLRPGQGCVLIYDRIAPRDIGDVNLAGGIVQERRRGYDWRTIALAYLAFPPDRPILSRIVEIAKAAATPIFTPIPPS